MALFLLSVGYANVVAGVMILLLCLIRRYGRHVVGSRTLYAAWLLVVLRLFLPLGFPRDDIVLGFVQPFASLPEDVPVIAIALTVTWVVGAVVIATMMIIQNRDFARKLGRKALPSRIWQQLQREIAPLGVKLPPVQRASFITSPCLYGARKPTILLPEKLDEGLSLKDALLHEACHAQTGDTRWALLSDVLCCLFWFNPLIWVMAKLSLIDAELACDESVLRYLYRDERRQYAQTIRHAEVRRTAPIAAPVTGMSFAGARLQERIYWIIQARQRNPWAVRMLYTGLLLIIVVSFIL